MNTELAIKNADALVAFCRAVRDEHGSHPLGLAEQVRADLHECLSPAGEIAMLREQHKRLQRACRNALSARYDPKVVNAIIQEAVRLYCKEDLQEAKGGAE